MPEVNHAAPAFQIRLAEEHRIAPVPHALIIDQPQARITNWAPAVRCSANLAHHFKHEQPLPIYVRIGFDRPYTDEYARNFFAVLRRLSRNILSNPITHGKFRNEFVITVPHSMPRAELQGLIEQVNRIRM